MKKVYLVPNFITALGLACGLFIIFKMNMVEPGASNYSLLQMAAILFFIAAVADVLDGAIARLMHAESDFGVQFDSLSDAITFGVAPSVTILKTLSEAPGSTLSFFAMTSALIYSVCGVLRLVRFNVKAQQNKGNIEAEKASKKSFTGLPIPAAAAAAITINLFFASDDFHQWFSISDQMHTLVMIISLAFLGYLMISRWKFPSLKSINFTIKSYHLVLITVLLAVFVLYGVLSHFALSALLISWGYIICALILAIIRLIAGRKSKTLEDFEPEPDDGDESENI